MTSRYDAPGNPETQYEPGSNERVLRNLLGIVDPAEMDDVELDLLDQLYDQIPNDILPGERITTRHIFAWHQRWLGSVYEWAGKERTVNLSKDGFQFALARHLGSLLSVFDSETLSKYTPCAILDFDELAKAIAIVHVEFILIHPFREGNGRMGRLLASVMAMQSGRPELNFSYWDTNKRQYFKAIHAGLDDYGPMIELVRIALSDSVWREDE